MFFKVATAMRQVLITGANRGLGLHCANAFKRHGQKLTLTARDINKFPKAYTAKDHTLLQLDMSAANIKATLAAIPNASLTTAVHCASPYSSSPLSGDDVQEREQVLQCLHNDVDLLTTLVREKLAPQGSLILAGAIVGDPDYLIKGLFSLYKASLRTQAELLANEHPSLRIIHMNLGTMSDDQVLVASGDALDIEEEAKYIYQLATEKHPSGNIDRFAPNDLRKVSAAVEQQQQARLG